MIVILAGTFLLAGWAVVGGGDISLAAVTVEEELLSILEGETVQAAGNALENVQEVFSDCRFVEYYYPGIRPENESFDWCALKVVLAPYNEEWYLVGLIHSEWTI